VAGPDRVCSLECAPLSIARAERLVVLPEIGRDDRVGRGFLRTVGEVFEPFAREIRKVTGQDEIPFGIRRAKGRGDATERALTRKVVFDRVEIEAGEPARSTNNANGVSDGAGKIDRAFDQRLAGNF